MPTGVTLPTWKPGIDLRWPLCAPRGPTPVALGWERLTLWNVTSGATEAEGARPKHLLPPVPTTGLPGAIALGVNRAAVRTPAGAPTTLVYGDYLVRVINQTRRMFVTRNPKVTKTVEAVRESKTPGVMEIIPEAIARFTLAVGEGEFYAVRFDGTISYTNNSVSLIVDTDGRKPDLVTAAAGYDLRYGVRPEKGGLNDMYMLLRKQGDRFTSLYLFRRGLATKVVFTDPLFGFTDAKTQEMFKDGDFIPAKIRVAPLGEYAALWVTHGDFSTTLCILSGAVGKVADTTADTKKTPYVFGEVVQIAPGMALYSRNGLPRIGTGTGLFSMVSAVVLGDNSAPYVIREEPFAIAGSPRPGTTFVLTYAGWTFSVPSPVTGWPSPAGTGNMPAVPSIVALGNGHAVFTIGTLRVPAGPWSTYDDYKPRSWFSVFHYSSGTVTELIPPKETPGFMAAAEVLYYPCGSGACLIAAPQGVGQLLDAAGKLLGYEFSYFRPGEALLALPGLSGDTPLAFVLKGDRSAEFITQKGPYTTMNMFEPARRMWDVRTPPALPPDTPEPSPVVLTGTFNESDLGYPHANLSSTSTGVYLAPGQCAFLSVVQPPLAEAALAARTSGVTLRARVYSEAAGAAQLKTLAIPAGSASVTHKDAPRYAVIDTTRNGVKRAVFVTTVTATGDLHTADLPAPSSAVAYLHEKTLCDVGAELRVLTKGGVPAGSYPGYSLSPLPSKPPVPDTKTKGTYFLVPVDRVLTPVGQNLCTYWPELFIDLTTEVFARN